MRRLLVAAALAVSLGATAAPALSDPTPSRQELPAQACNQGTETAHGSIPATAPPHERVPHEHPEIGPGCFHRQG
jgi:hypothetical protein